MRAVRMVAAAIRAKCYDFVYLLLLLFFSYQSYVRYEKVPYLSLRLSTRSSTTPFESEFGCFTGQRYLLPVLCTY
jgi:hypothetical protein